jgi:hypothetical protein
LDGDAHSERTREDDAPERASRDRVDDAIGSTRLTESRQRRATDRSGGVVVKSNADLVGLQRVAVGSCLADLEARGLDAVWHWNRCDCCVSVHERIDTPTGGYIVNSDGDVSWEESVE